MTNEEKQLLLQDLSARLTYGMKARTTNIDIEIWEINIDAEMLNDDSISIENIKPYLRPMSSMTGEEMFEIEMMNNHSIQRIDTVGVRFKSFYDTAYNEMYDLFDWLNAHHFDYRGLIDKGLALEAPEGMYKTE